MARFNQEAPDHAGLMRVCLSLSSPRALFTEAIGIHALFGAFLAGVVLPRRKILGVPVRERLETFSTVFLLPLFFAFTGLRTQIGLLNTWESWLFCGVIIAGDRRQAGRHIPGGPLDRNELANSLSIGALMNTRGLMELIALNIGYELGILSAKVFSMMVIMALATTMMTGPMLTLLKSRARRDPAERAEKIITPEETGI